MQRRRHPGFPRAKGLRPQAVRGASSPGVEVEVSRTRRWRSTEREGSPVPNGR
jgi:hypothetical protein